MSELAAALAATLQRYDLHMGHLVPMSPRALGWRLGRQVYEFLTAEGFHEQRLLTVDLASPTSADLAYLAALHARVNARFASTLAAYQAHMRVIEKLQRAQVQPIAQLGRAQTKLDKILTEVKNFGRIDENGKLPADIPEKLRGQYGAANGEVVKARTQVEAGQAKIDAEFAAAALDKVPFMTMRAIEECTRQLGHVGSDAAAAMLWLQHNLLLVDVWYRGGINARRVINPHL